MTRWPFHTLAALSLALCAALLLGWSRAQLGEAVWLRFAGHSLIAHGADGPGVQSSRGFFFEPPARGPADPTYAGPRGLLRMLRSGSLRTTATRFAGVEYYIDATSPIPKHRTLVLPVAYPLLLAAAAPAIWAATRARRRRRSGCCAACGYDLRATPDRCPECGKQPESTQQQHLSRSVQD